MTRFNNETFEEYQERMGRAVDRYHAFLRLPWYRRLWMILLMQDPTDPYER